MTTSRPRRSHVAALVLTGVLALAVTGFAATRVLGGGQPSFNGTPYPDSPPAPDFTLTSHTGEELDLASLRGRAVLLFFGFTSCPDVCPITLAALTRVLEARGIGGDEAQVLLVTVDPEADTPEKLAAYVGKFGSNVTGLTGSAELLSAVQKDYGIYARLAPGHHGGETLVHNTVVFGIDRSGRMQVLMHPENGDEQLGEDIEELVAID